MTKIDWIRGDSLGLNIPAHSGSLRAGAEPFLTGAFRAAGSISKNNRVTRITAFDEISGGSTGCKLLLSLEYEKPSPCLHTDLFVKFSRNFADDIRDRARVQMELETSFALLSRNPEFPIAVPVCYFADYHHESGTGILITQRITYGNNAIERHYPKCLDYQMPDPLGHYRAIVRTLARLAGTHKAGRLPDWVETRFAFDPAKLVVSIRNPYTPKQVSERVARYAQFANNYPQLLPENIRTADFLTRLAEEAPRFQALEGNARRILQSKPDMIALCHWNAHIDNAWFWRGGDNQLESGLMDWGNVSQMNVAMALWGCLSGAEIGMWNHHLDELLALFSTEFKISGGPALDPVQLRLHLLLYVAMMGLAWMLDVPQLALAKIPDLAEVSSRRDPRVESNERARSQLLIMTAFLNLWERENMAKVIDRLERGLLS